jgi:hypothetical protein
MEIPEKIRIGRVTLELDRTKTIFQVRLQKMPASTAGTLCEAAILMGT